MNTFLLAMLVSAMVAGGQNSDIVDLNPPQKVLPTLLSARALGGTWNAPATEDPLTLLHFSDLHGDCVNLARIVEFRKAYSQYIADAIHTGDAVSCYIDDVNPWKKVEGAASLINVIGNHDCWKGHKTWAETDIPYDASAKDAYNAFIKPFVKKWSVVQPEGVDKPQSPFYCACYFHKDYPSSKVRLVVLDCMHYDRIQDEWFAKVLDEALSKGYTVIGAQHYFSQTGLRSIDSGFSTNDGIAPCSDPSRPQIECMREAAFITLDGFIDKGGEFVCWLSGHDHEDYIGYVQGHERQLQVLIAKAGEKDIYMHEDRTRGTVNQDCFNLVTINPGKHIVVMQRIGCTRGALMRSKKLFCYDYRNRSVVVNE